MKKVVLLLGLLLHTSNLVHAITSPNNCSAVLAISPSTSTAWENQSVNLAASFGSIVSNPTIGSYTWSCSSSNCRITTGEGDNLATARTTETATVTLSAVGTCTQDGASTIYNQTATATITVSSGTLALCSESEMKAGCLDSSFGNATGFIVENFTRNLRRYTGLTCSQSIEARNIAVDSSNNIHLAGYCDTSSTDYGFLLSYDTTGNVISNYHVSAFNLPIIPIGNFESYDLLPDTSGNLFTAGSLAGTHSNITMTTVPTTVDALVDFQQLTLTSAVSDEGKSLAFDNNGNLLMLGQTPLNSDSGTNEIYLFRYTKDTSNVWALDTTFGLGFQIGSNPFVSPNLGFSEIVVDSTYSHNEATQVLVDANNDIYIVGYATTSLVGDDDDDNPKSVFIVKYSSDGNHTIFTKSFALQNRATSAMFDTEGRIVVVGTTDDEDTTKNGVFILKVNTDLTESFSQLETSSSSQEISLVAASVDPHGNIVLAGNIEEEIMHYTSVLARLKWDTTTSTYSYDTAFNNSGYFSFDFGNNTARTYDMALDSNNNIILTGKTTQGSRSKFFVARFDGVICGNGVLEGTETCDDSNTAAGDGCSDTCQTEATEGTGSTEGSATEGASSSGGAALTEGAGASGNNNADSGESSGCSLDTNPQKIRPIFWTLPFMMLGLGLGLMRMAGTGRKN